MGNGWSNCWWTLLCVACVCEISSVAHAQDGLDSAILDILLSSSGQSSTQTHDSHDDKEGHSEDSEHAPHVHFRRLPGQTHRAPVHRAPLPPAPPGNKILDPSGQIRKLVLLLRFKGHEDRQLPTPEIYDIVFNRIGGHEEYATSGSALDYSREVSYGKMTIRTHIVDWIDLPETEQYYANGDSGDTDRIAEAIRFALDHVDQKELIDFRDFDRNGDGYADLFSVLHSGYGAEFGGDDVHGVPHTDRLWSHKSRIPYWTSRKSHVRVSDYSMSTGLRGVKGSAPCRIGLLAHEVAHLGQLPDLYDGGVGLGIGSWGLLGFSDGFNLTGHTPTHFSPWAKHKLKWIVLKDLTVSGTYTIKQVEEFPDVYRIQEGFPEGEYLLIENRQPVLFDRELPGGIGGLAIWHVDENKKHNREPGHPDIPGWPENNAHYKVALVQADGRFDLERGLSYGDEDDLFRGGGVDRVSSREPHGLRPYRIDPTVRQVLHRISEISAPGKTMTFRYEVESTNSPVPQPKPNLKVSSEPRPNADTQGAATSSAPDVIIPITGVHVASAEFSHEDRKQLSGDGILLETKIELTGECIVQIRGSASVTSSVSGNSLSTGLSDDRSSRPAMWRNSVRLVSTSTSGSYSRLSVNCRRKMDAGLHTIRWVVRSQGAVQFPGGGTLTIQVYPCPPRRSPAENN
jgi:M6 family metalloprotease-like protein